MEHSFNNMEPPVWAVLLISAPFWFLSLVAVFSVCAITIIHQKYPCAPTCRPCLAPRGHTNQGQTLLEEEHALGGRPPQSLQPAGITGVSVPLGHVELPGHLRCC